MSRDPIGEEGGANLYGFVGNDGISGIDLLGNEDLTIDVDFTYTEKVDGGIDAGGHPVGPSTFEVSLPFRVKIAAWCNSGKVQWGNAAAEMLKSRQDPALWTEELLMEGGSLGFVSITYEARIALNAREITHKTIAGGFDLSKIKLRVNLYKKISFGIPFLRIWGAHIPREIYLGSRDVTFLYCCPKETEK